MCYVMTRFIPVICARRRSAGMAILQGTRLFILEKSMRLPSFVKYELLIASALV